MSRSTSPRGTVGTRARSTLALLFLPSPPMLHRFLCVVLGLTTALLVQAAPAPASAIPVGVTQVQAVEGITEYRLPNGLQLLLIPDDAKPTTTVNMTYHVGSRHENYGETGMAHLLEHLLFKGSKKHPN